MKARKYVTFSGDTAINPTRELLEHDAACYGRIAANYMIMMPLTAAYCYAEQAVIYARSAARSALRAMKASPSPFEQMSDSEQRKLTFRYSEVMRFIQMREAGDYLPEDMPSLDELRRELAEMDKLFQAA